MKFTSRTTRFVALLSILIVSQSFAQESRDNEWGLKQRLEERQKYWNTWIYSGPDTNIAEAHERGLKQFLAIGRPKQFAQSLIPAWEQVSSSIHGAVSGRPTGIAFDPTNFQIMYLATSGGGLWKTINQGKSWASISGSWGSYATGDVVVDYSNPNIIYAGTGDLYDRGGDGIYKSTDAGLNWTRVATAGKVGSQTHQMIIDPATPTTIYHVSSNGINKSTDAGASWNRLTALPIGGIPHLVIDPSNANKLIAGGSGVIVVSTDGGATWSGDNAANIGGKNRITLAISKKDPSKVYASISNGGNRSLGVARSLNGGDTWELSASADYMSDQGWYNNACAVSPINANRVQVGGLDVWNSFDSGTTLTKRSEWTAAPSAANFCHADVHVLRYGPTNDLYALTDGGVFVSKSNGNSWSQSLNTNLSTLLFVGADADHDMTYVLGGCQDNGVNYAKINDPTFRETAGGDAGRSFVAQDNAGTAYSTYIYANLRRSSSGGVDFSDNILAGTALGNEGAPFYMYYDVSETDGNVLALCGNSKLYYSTNGGFEINAISKSNAFSGGFYSVHVAGADPNVLYVGSGSNYSYTTTDAGTTWKKSTKSIGLVAGFCSDLTNAANAYACIAGYGNKHFWRTTDYGNTWEAPAKNLPDINAYTIARAPNGDLFIGHAFGVMRSIDNGVNWEPLRDGLPLCDVRKLQVRGKNNEYLLAATYGRGLFKIKQGDLPRNNIGVANSKSDPSAVSINAIIPNPLINGSELRVKFTVAKAGITTMKLFDELGREVRTLFNESVETGSHESRIDVKGISAGNYFLVVTANGTSATKNVIIH